ncbi:hypothetical protein Tco_0185047 [Tanacetum coccineum]
MKCGRSTTLTSSKASTTTKVDVGVKAKRLRYGKCVSLENSEYVFEGMCRRDVVSWSTMINWPNEVTVVSVVAACAALDSLSLCKRVHSYVEARRDTPIEGNMANEKHYAFVVDLYASTRRLKEADDLDITWRPINPLQVLHVLLSFASFAKYSIDSFGLNRYATRVKYISSCYSGCLFEPDVLKDDNIYAVSDAICDELTKACSKDLASIIIDGEEEIFLHECFARLIAFGINYCIDILVFENIWFKEVRKILGFPSISLISVSGPKWAPCLARIHSNRVLADGGSLLRTFLGPQKVALVGLGVHYDNTVLLDSGSDILHLPRLLVFPRRFLILVGKTWLTWSLRGLSCVLTQEAFDAFCEAFHIPKELHPVLPSRNDTMHERPTGRLGYILEMDLFSFIHVSDPTKVKVTERERREGEPPLLETTVGCTVPLLPIAPDRAKDKLEDSVDRLFDEGGSGDQTYQGGSVGGASNVHIQPVSEAADTAVEDVAPLQPRRQRKRKATAVDASGASHPPKTLRKYHGASSRVGIAALPTLPFVTSSVSATPEHKGRDNTDSITGYNLRTIGAPQRFVISLDSSHHSGTHVAETEVDSLIRSSALTMTTAGTVTVTAGAATVVKETAAKPSLFATGSSSAGGTKHTPDCREMVDEFAPPKFFASVRGIEHDQLFVEFNVGAARQMTLGAEVRMRAEYNIKEKKRLKSVVDDQVEVLKVKEKEMEDLKAQLLLKEAEAAEAIRLRAEASKFEAVEKSFQDEIRSLKERNTALEKEKGELDVRVGDLAASVKVRKQEVDDLDAVVTSVRSQNDNLVDQVHQLETSSAKLQEEVTMLDKLYVDFVEMALHLEENFYPHLLTTISGRRWLLTQGMELAIAKCLNSTEYLSALGAAISKAVEKGMSDGLSAGITHGMKGRVLADVAMYNPSVEADYISALQRLQNINFSLIAELRSNKDASIETIMNIIHLDDAIAERLGLTELQPHVDQLMVPIHHSPDQRVVGASALSLSLDVSRTEGASDDIPATAGTTTALSITFVSASSTPPISTDDYEVVHADDQGNAGVDVDPFPNVDDAELNIS